MTDPLLPIAMVDMTADFFHVCTRDYPVGAHKPAGTYGAAIRVASSQETVADPLGEHLRERIRLESYPHKPSRFASTFVCETLDDALEYRQNWGRKGAIYRVRFLDPNAPVHKVCLSAFRMPTTPHEPPADVSAHEFWRNPPVYASGGSEVFAQSGIEILALCEPPIP